MQGVCLSSSAGFRESNAGLINAEKRLLATRLHSEKSRSVPREQKIRELVRAQGADDGVAFYAVTRNGVVNHIVPPAICKAGLSLTGHWLLRRR
jgi:hypothetical protein